MNLKLGKLMLLAIALLVPSNLVRAVPSVSCDLPLETALLRGRAQVGVNRGRRSSASSAFSRRRTDDIVTDETIAESGVTVPSLWWAQEQFDPFEGRLVRNWIAYQTERRIDLVVNRQLWTLLDYLKRYRFLNNLGTAAREYRYSLRIFNQQQKCLAIYRCDFALTPPQCEIQLDLSGQDSSQFDRDI